MTILKLKDYMQIIDLIDYIILTHSRRRHDKLKVSQCTVLLCSVSLLYSIISPFHTDTQWSDHDELPLLSSTQQFSQGDILHAAE